MVFILNLFGVGMMKGKNFCEVINNVSMVNIIIDGD